MLFWGCGSPFNSFILTSFTLQVTTSQAKNGSRAVILEYERAHSEIILGPKSQGPKALWVISISRYLTVNWLQSLEVLEMKDILWHLIDNLGKSSVLGERFQSETKRWSIAYVSQQPCWIQNAFWGISMSQSFFFFTNLCNFPEITSSSEGNMIREIRPSCQSASCLKIPTCFQMVIWRRSVKRETI